VSRRTLTLTSVTTSSNARTARSPWRGVRMDCSTMARAARTNTATTTGQWTAAPARPTVRTPPYGRALLGCLTLGERGPEGSGTEAHKLSFVL